MSSAKRERNASPELVQISVVIETTQVWLSMKVYNEWTEEYYFRDTPVLDPEVELLIWKNQFDLSAPAPECWFETFRDGVDYIAMGYKESYEKSYKKNRY